jgi:hypothetical protein
MGDNFLKQQVRNFKKGRDKALDKLSKPTLFTIPETAGKTYPVFESSGHTVSSADVLLVVPSRTPGRVELVRGTQPVGYADGEPAAPLLAASGGVGVYVRVESKNELSGVAHVRIIEAGGAA